MLPDASAARVRLNESGRQFLLSKLEKIDTTALSRAEQIDVHILTQRVKLDQFQVQKLEACWP